MAEDPMAAPVSEPVSEPFATRGELLFALKLVVGLIVLGAVLGLVWHEWSTTATLGRVYLNHAILPDETEGFISSDGRFLVLTSAAGLLAALVAWSRRAWRGPVTAAALAVGGTLGALVTDGVGRLVGGGRSDGALNELLRRLPLQVHATALLPFEGGVALIVYLIAVLFASRDDLGADGPAQLELAST
jgi:hypothetical protein